MIHVDRSQVQEPAVLAPRDSRAAEERTKAHQHYEDYRTDSSPDRGKLKSYAFKVYKDPEVKQCLEGLFHGKCAYCESFYTHIHPVDIEHFRPKAAVVAKNGTLIKPGYYWLASTWANLLPSCIDCNRARTHEHGDRDPEVSGKANLFPVQNDRRRSLRPGAESRESRLLLDPCTDDPEEYLSFRNDGQVTAVRDAQNGELPEGVESIAVYGLNRRALIDRRFAIVERLRSQVDHIERKLDDIGDQQAAESDLSYLSSLVRDLRDFMAATEEYAGMASQLLVNHKILDDLDQELRYVLRHRYTRKPRGRSWAEVLVEDYPPGPRRRSRLGAGL